ncbi:hypothetical protein BJ546DRAFT_599332 [Cryomyces antarcticus]
MHTRGGLSASIWPIELVWTTLLHDLPGLPTSGFLRSGRSCNCETHQSRGHVDDRCQVANVCGDEGRKYSRQRGIWLYNCDDCKRRTPLEERLNRVPHVHIQREYQHRGAEYCVEQVLSLVPDSAVCPRTLIRQETSTKTRPSCASTPQAPNAAPRTYA